MVVVAPAGPPCVMTNACSNPPCNPPIRLIVSTKNVVGLTIGHVIAQNRCQAFATSMSAASYNSGDTPCSAARYKIMLYPPTTVQKLMNISAGWAHVTDVSHCGGHSTPSPRIPSFNHRGNQFAMMVL